MKKPGSRPILDLRGLKMFMELTVVVNIWCKCCAELTKIGWRRLVGGMVAIVVFFF